MWYLEYMNVQAINYLKKFAHAALQNRKFGVAKGLCRAEFSKNVDTSFQKNFVDELAEIL